MPELDIDHLYRTYRPLVLRRARAILGDEDNAKDAMQEVFVRALRSADRFRGEASPATWLYRMTTNLCLNMVRDRRRADRLVEHWAGEQQLDHHYEEKLAASRVLRALPGELREIAVYYFLDQMNQDEIAQIMNVSRRTVGNRIDEFRRRAVRRGADWRKVS